MIIRLADASKDPKAATAAAKAYFSDLNDITEWAIKKRGDVVNAAFEKSVKDLATFNALVK
jgi:hypothetical protein